MNRNDHQSNGATATVAAALESRALFDARRVVQLLPDIRRRIENASLGHTGQIRQAIHFKVKTKAGFGLVRLSTNLFA